jgi:hypothetical protein
MPKADFREFLLRASGSETDPERMTLLETVDNLNMELAKLRAVAALMEGADADEAGGELLKAAGGLVDEIHRRMRRILDLGTEANRPRSVAAICNRRRRARGRKR